MAYFDRLKRDIQMYFGKWGSVHDHKPGVVRDLSRPQRIVMFFCVGSKTELDEVRKLVRAGRARKEKVTAYVFSLEQERIDVITDKSIFYFDLNDFTLFGKKKDYLQEAFDKEDFELMISFLNQPDPFCYKLASQVKAGFKVGPEHPGLTGIYDLTLDFDIGKKGYQEFYDYTRHYLSVLNIKTR